MTSSSSPSRSFGVTKDDDVERAYNISTTVSHGSAPIRSWAAGNPHHITHYNLCEHTSVAPRFTNPFLAPVMPQLSPGDDDQFNQFTTSYDSINQVMNHHRHQPELTHGSTTTPAKTDGGTCPTSTGSSRDDLTRRLLGMEIEECSGKAILEGENSKGTKPQRAMSDIPESASPPPSLNDITSVQQQTAVIDSQKAVSSQLPAPSVNPVPDAEKRKEELKNSSPTQEGHILGAAGDIQPHLPIAHTGSRSQSHDIEPPLEVETIHSASSSSSKCDSAEAEENPEPATDNAATTSSSEDGEDHEKRTTDLIKKQINEIEKEITRRIQNKNVKKIDENELAQLLSDHGFGSFVGATSINGSQILGASINYFQEASTTGGIAPIDPTKPSLNQLRCSFSPPSTTASGYATSESPCMSQVALQANPASFTTTTYLQGNPAALVGVMPQGAAAFACGAHQQPQSFVNPSSQLHYQHCQHVQSGHPTVPYQQQQQSAHPQFPAPMQAQFNPLYSAPFPPQLQNHPLQLPQIPSATAGQRVLPQVDDSGPTNARFNESPPLIATALPPTLSSITPEMAAALLQQLQQQNPNLIASLVGQQSQHTPNTQQQNADLGRIPSPPKPQYNISRREPVNRKSSSGSMGNARKTTTPRQSEDIGYRDVGAHYSNSNRRHGSISKTSSSGSSSHSDRQQHQLTHNGGSENKENGQGGQDPVWVMRDSYLKRLQRDELRSRGETASHDRVTGEDGAVEAKQEEEEEHETDKLLAAGTLNTAGNEVDCQVAPGEQVENGVKKKGSKKEAIIHEPAVLIEGVLFRARYLGSTQLTCDGRPTKVSRMAQAQEAVARVKAPEGEIQPSTEIDLFISTEKIMVLNTDLQDILMDHSLRSISYIADIGDVVVLMARRVPTEHRCGTDSDDEANGIGKTPKVVCHVFESEESAFIAQSIGQAFQVAYVEFLRANGIDDPAYLREIDYQDVLNSQEMLGEELEMFARKETQKDVVVPKKVGEPLGIVVVESGWGSMVPTAVIANMAPGGPASRSNQVNIGDQIIAINGISLVGLPLAAAQQNIKNAKTSTAVRLTVVSTPPVVEVRIKRPETRYQLGFSVQNGVICSLLRGGIAERGGIRVGHRIIEINHQSVVAVPHDRIVNMLATASGEIHMKTMPTSMFRLLTGQEQPNYI